MFVYIIHLFTFCFIYSCVILLDYVSLVFFAFDFFWIFVLNIIVLDGINSYICFVFVCLYCFCFSLLFSFLSLDGRLTFLIILLQYLVVFSFLVTCYIIFLTILFELFSLLLFILLLSTRFGYKVLVLWYYYMLNLVSFLLIFLLLYFMLFHCCFFVCDFCFLIFDDEWLGVLCIFYVLGVVFKLYFVILVLFVEQLYIRLGAFTFIYMLCFYVLFCFILIILLICFVYFYLIFLKLVVLQSIGCAIIGLNRFAIISLLFILSVNNFGFLFLILISTKHYIFYLYLNFHMFYCFGLIVLLTLYNFFLIYNIFDFCFNGSALFITFVFFSFFNDIILSVLIACMVLCIGAVPITFGFFLKTFCLVLQLNYLSSGILFFSIFWLIIIFLFYFRLIVNIFVFSYLFLGFWVIRLSTYFLMHSVFFYLLACFVYFLILLTYLTLYYNLFSEKIWIILNPWLIALSCYKIYIFVAMHKTYLKHIKKYKK